MFNKRVIGVRPPSSQKVSQESIIKQQQSKPTFNLPKSQLRQTVAVQVDQNTKKIAPITSIKNNHVQIQQLVGSESQKQTSSFQPQINPGKITNITINNAPPMSQIISKPQSTFPNYYQIQDKTYPHQPSQPSLPSQPQMINQQPAVSNVQTTTVMNAISQLVPGDLRAQNQYKSSFSYVCPVEKKEEVKYVFEDQDTQLAKKAIHNTIPNVIQKIPTSTTKGLVGLRNIGNTCFMNSVLQCILNSPNIFNDSFIDGAYKKDLNPKNKGIASEYSQLIQRIKQGQNFTAESPHNLKRAIEKQSNQFAGYEQQDAQELMIQLLEGINQDMNKIQTKATYREMNDDLTNKTIQQLSTEWWNYHKSRENSIVQDQFVGQLLNKVQCLACSKEALAFDTFIDVQLSLSRSLKKLDNMELLRLIEMFLQEEQLDESYCQKCKKNQKSKRQFLIWRLPNILVFTIKRFNFRRFNSDKLQNKIQFPIENLDLSSLVRDSGDQSVKRCNYSLFGIVNHSGSLSGGHYTADCMSPVDKKWYRFNDSNVNEINISSQGYQTQGSSSPYILFYCRSELI